jgi:glycosyltransferase involved in cell wall biosynthesis
MRIAQVAPLYEAVPPRLYGGTERVVAYLTDALVDAGHDVTLFASAESRTKAKLVGARDRAIRLDKRPLKSDVSAHLAMLHEVRRRADEFDIIHFHLELLHFPVFEDIPHCTVTTLHGRLDLLDLPRAHKRWPAFPLVSISHQQRDQLPSANWLGTVHHGLPPDLLHCAVRPTGDYLAFLGRISREKRTDRAIRIAARAGLPLKIAAKVDSSDRDYFTAEIEPLLPEGKTELIGEIGDAQKSDFLGNAAALLVPIDWPEPFGLVMIEAMACGTPVIAWDRGAVPEIIEDGVTGFIVNSIDEAVDAISRLPTLRRDIVRSTFERRFSASTMAGKYVELYRHLLPCEGVPAPQRSAVAAT